MPFVIDPPATTPVRDVNFGRIKLVTVFDDISESVGESLEAIGAALAAAERRPRSVRLVLPLHGSSSDGIAAYTVGDRMRRQLRALLENGPARMQGIYFTLTFDPELNGWFLVGGGDIEYDDGGPTLSSYKLNLTDAYRVARRLTHQRALRVEAYDRRLATTPRDYLSRLYSTDFASSSNRHEVVLPFGAFAATATPQRVPLHGSDSRPSVPGECIVAYDTNAVHGTVLTFEQLEASQHNATDVVVWDRRGVLSTPTYLQDPQATHGWEEVYGPQHPLLASDVPVVANGFCRVRWDDATDSFRVDAFVEGTGYVEQGAIVPYQNPGGAGTRLRYQTFRFASVVEWTTERAVLRVVLEGGGGVDRVDIYITLQRGWSGPRFEAYLITRTALPTLKPPIELRWHPFTSGTAYMAQGLSALMDSTVDWNQLDRANFASLEPWVAHLIAGTTLWTFAVPPAASTILHTEISSDVYGASRNGFGFVERQVTITGEQNRRGYISMQLGFGANRGTFAEAESGSFTRSGTATVAADGAASGGSAVNDTQTSALANTISAEPSSAILGTQPFGKYAIWVRVRSNTGGTLFNITAGFTANGSATNGLNTGSSNAVSTASLTYVWLYVGDFAWLQDLTGSDFWVRGYGSAGGKIDRVLLIPTEQRSATFPEYDGVRDFAASTLVDLRAVPELVAR